MPSSAADGPSAPRLTVLDDVTWEGAPVPGERTHALLRGLADAGKRGLSERALVEEVWGDDVPANPTKALQVVVSRARAATGHDVIERTARGYRLALEPAEVDTWALRPEGLRLAAAGEYAAALPLLERAEPDDEVVVALLRAVAGVHGVPAALERYEAYRVDLANRLGVDPGPELQALHTELLARDRPVREGLLYEASRLIGRDGDVAALAETIRSSRVTSIVGAGGLGKTRLAHLMGRLAEQPVVHFVELAGVTSPEGVAVEVGDTLGVRESVAGRLTSAAARRTDLVSRIVDQIGTAPALLIVDNCEHLIESVADLVQQLVTRTPNLKVLTTTRAPLGIAAERVYQLPELRLEDAVELFDERATAARPGVRLDPTEVRTLVARLDGLPLAVELAAAKVRVMSVAEIGRRLENRFALLSGGSREAPERHQTLLAVIDWSWNLLDDEERTALRRLSVFRDGFSLAGADAVVDGDALVPLSALVDQSLVSVVETPSGLRYRMLETVREFGQMQLIDAGDDADTARRQRDWGFQFTLDAQATLFSSTQTEVMTQIRAEEGNLVDVLRRAIRGRDARAVIVLMACLSDFWTIEGSHLKVVGLSGEVEDVIVDVDYDDDLETAMRTTLTSIAFNAMIFTDSATSRALSRLEKVGWGNGASPSEAQAKVLLAVRVGRHEDASNRFEELFEDPEVRVRQVAFQWASSYSENLGNLDLARRYAEKSWELVDGRDGPWPRALVASQLAGLTMQVGDVREAVEYAELAIPTMEALGATEDVAQLKAVVATAAMQDGRLDEAGRIFDEIATYDSSLGVFGAALVLLCGRPELDLAAGRIEEGLRGYRHAVEVLSNRSVPGLSDFAGLAPWQLYAEAAAVAAHIRHSRLEPAIRLHADLVEKLPQLLETQHSFVDYPVAGSVMFAVALWELAAAPDGEPDEQRVRAAVRLLAMSDAFGYNRQLPSLSWAPAAELADRVVPGELARVHDALRGEHAPELRFEARRLVGELGS